MTSPFVLVVSNSCTLRESLSTFLSSTVKVATLGTAAPAATLEFVDRRLPDLVIIDALNQHRQEVALVQELKRRWPKLRCLVLATGRAEQQAAQEAGADESLLWGSVRDQLDGTVLRLLSARETGAGPGPGRAPDAP